MRRATAFGMIGLTDSRLRRGIEAVEEARNRVNTEQAIVRGDLVAALAEVRRAKTHLREKSRELEQANVRFETAKANIERLVAQELESE